MAVAMIIVGLVISLGAFIFAVRNMTSGSGTFDGMFKNHGKAMIAMAIGGVLFVAGLILGAAQILQGLVN